MKANELMIGDWVQDISFVTIESLCSEDICTYRNKEGFIYTANISNMKPVPLTAEILEKNGFNQNGIPEDMQPVEERDYYDETYVWSEIVDDYKENEVSVYLEYGKECVEIHCIKGSMDIECKYVHQLQHALKVCGIDKNIVL